VRGGILKGTRGPHGGYTIAREYSLVTAGDILTAAETVDAPEEEPKSDLVINVVLPVLSAVEEECGLALSRISLDDIMRRAAASNGHDS
jgi:DNA-binding IscR family transcriptional regulator